MIKPPPNVLELPLHVGAGMALKAAVANAIEEHVQQRLPIYIWRDEQVVDILLEELLKRGLSLNDPIYPEKKKMLPPNILELPLEERALMALTAAVEEIIEENVRCRLP